MQPESRLEIFIEAGCPNCIISHDLADWVRINYPRLSIKVIDLNSSTGQIPEAVFAVPAYLLDGKTIFLGNPDRDELGRIIEEEGIKNN